jgi:hypothetical protein
MELFKIRKDIPFMRHALVLNAVSFITFALAVFFLFSRGLHLSVEFTGGTLMEVSYSQPADLQKVRGTVATLGFSEVQVQNFGSARDVMIRLPAQKGVSSAQQSEKVLTALKANDPDVTLRRTEFVGPQVGDELAEDGAGLCGDRHHDLSGDSLRVEVCRLGHHRQLARRHHHSGVFRLLPVGVFAGGVGRGAGGVGLFGERIGGDF